MALFSRNKKVDSRLPEEVQQYYAGERRQRAGVAWLLALGTLVLTVAIAFALFWGGRWLYRTIANRDDNKKSPTITQQVSKSENSDSNSTSGKTGTSSTSTDKSSPTSTSTITTTGGSSSKATTPSATTPTTTPNTGPSQGVSTLVDTGPGANPDTDL